MKRRRLPDGTRVAAVRRLEHRFLYREIFVDRPFHSYCRPSSFAASVPGRTSWVRVSSAASSAVAAALLSGVPFPEQASNTKAATVAMPQLTRYIGLSCGERLSPVEA